MTLSPSKMRLWIGILLTSALVGCFEYRESVEVFPDGHIELKMLSTINEQVLPFIRNRPEFQMYAASSVGKEKLQEIVPKGVKVLTASSVRENGWVHSDVQMSFENISAMSGTLGELSDDTRIKYFQDEDGSLVYERIVFKPKMPDEMPRSVEESFMKKQWQTAQLYFELKTPLQVIETNGLKVTETKIVWQTNFANVRTKGLRLFARFAPPKPETGWIGFLTACALMVAVSFVLGKKTVT